MTDLAKALVQPEVGGGIRLTRAGFERAGAIKRRIVDDALRTAPMPLSANAAMWLARWHRVPYSDPPVKPGERDLWLTVEDAAWMLAQHQVLDGRVRSIAFSVKDCENAERLGATFDEPPRRAAMVRATTRPLSEGMQATMRLLADQHRAAVIGEQPA